MTDDREMQVYKSILVLLKGVKGDGAALSAAMQAARPSAGHLACLHVRPGMEEIVSRLAIFDLEDPNIVQDMLGKAQQQGVEAAGRAAELFSLFCTKESISRTEFPPGGGTINASFREMLGSELDVLIAESRYHDLVVVKDGGEETGGLSSSELGRLVMHAGRPILLAPSVPAQPIRTAVIAWKTSPEAARALTAAMPLLAAAKKIHVLHAREGEEGNSGGESVVRLLQWHGLKAESQLVEPGDREPADAVLEMARAANADLLVMGAYGRSRLSELILGGFTECILEDAAIPVLLFH
jgi:nucleotide-binding universal stress UspA family protein